MACQGHYMFPSDALQTDIMYPQISAFDEPDCLNHPSMICQCDIKEDFEMEVSPNTYSLSQAVNIIIAVKKLKRFQGMSSGKFCKDELLNYILENVIEERLVKPVNVTPIYSRDKRTSVQCTICDKYKKTLVRSNTVDPQDLHLKAVTLSAGNIQYKVRFNMSTYVASRPESKGQPVCLGIANSNLYIACSESDGPSPVLLLKEVSTPLNTIKAGDPNDSLLFFRKETGTAYNTFESVKYPGWFVTTDFDDWKRVEMHQVPTDRTSNFTLEDQQVISS